MAAQEEKDVIQYELAPNGICRIWLNRPHKRNCVSPQLLRDLEAGHATEGAHIVGDMLARARSFGIDPGPLRLAWCHLQAADNRRQREAAGG